MTRSGRGNEAADFDILRALAWVWLGCDGRGSSGGDG